MKYLFIGNRRFVLEELLKKTDDVSIVCIKGTHLQRDRILEEVPHKVAQSSAEVHAIINEGDFDILISNGLPYILDIENLPKRTYANIHPSYLPDLRGIDPVLGSILFKRDSGATCHIMNNKIDDGDIISQVKIKYSDDLNASLLYQLSFLAEKECFNDAWTRGFKPSGPQLAREDLIYFSRNPRSRILNFQSSDELIIQTVKAFDNSNQGARFYINGKEYKCHQAWLSNNEYLLKKFGDSAENTIIMAYEDTIVVKRESAFLFLSEVDEVSRNLVGQGIG